VQPTALSPEAKASIMFEAMEANRLAAPFERLRDRSDQRLRESGRRPRIFLANLGTPADFTARATFAKSFFETGGIEAIDNEGFADPSVLAGAYKSTGAPLVCLCSSDKVYAQRATATAEALQSAGAKHIYLAGRPGEQEAELRAAGIDSFIAVGSDALSLLNEAYDLMERA